MSSKALIASIEQSVDLLPCPAVAQRVIAATSSSDLSAGDVESIILCDGALAARVLKIANSAYYGVTRRVTSVRHAIVVLGFRVARNAAVTAALGAWFKRGRQAGRLRPRDIWRHSLHVAVAARVVARERLPEADAEDAFLAGLLHDLGIQAALEASPHGTQRVLDLRDSRDVAHLDAERQVLGTDHCRLVDLLLRRWALPDDLRRSAANHHAFEGTQDGLSPVGQAVAAAESVCAGRDFFTDGVRPDRLPGPPAVLGTPDEIRTLEEAVEAQWRQADDGNG